MESVRDHYDKFLSPVFSWILGDFQTAATANADYFAAIGLVAPEHALAIDLGSGSGCQSVPLADIGFRVKAIDFCQPLLDELVTNAGDRQVEPICDDVLNFSAYLDNVPELIVCMGDTLVHLPDRESVDQLLDKVCDALGAGGMFLYAIRDYTGEAPTGADRFIPIRANDEQVFTCFLDYADDVVHVHDLLYRKENGSWRLSISDYQKLRLDTAVINAQLVQQGLEIVDTRGHDGMIAVLARKA